MESALAQNAYAAASPCTGSARSVELRLLARVTRQLTGFIGGASARTTPELAQAINDNERLWRAFAIDVANEENKLTVELRSKLFYLYEFTLNHGRKVLAGDAGTDVLVDINKAVMRGLSAGNEGSGEE